MFPYRIKCICGCRLENFTLEDWLCHWKSEVVMETNVSKLAPNWLADKPKLRAIYFLFKTKIKIERK